MPTRHLAPCQTRTGNQGRLAAAEQEIPAPTNAQCCELCSSLHQQIGDAYALDLGRVQAVLSRTGLRDSMDVLRIPERRRKHRNWWRSSDIRLVQVRVSEIQADRGDMPHPQASGEAACSPRSPREKKQDLCAWAGSWSFSAPGLPRFPHPSHTTKRSNGASGRDCHCHLSCSFCHIGLSLFFFPLGGGGSGGRRANLQTVTQGLAPLARMEVRALGGTSRATWRIVGLVAH